MKWRWWALGLFWRLSAHVAWFLDGLDAERRANRIPRRLRCATCMRAMPLVPPEPVRTWVDGLETIMSQPACWQAWLTSPNAPHEAEVRW